MLNTIKNNSESNGFTPKVDSSLARGLGIHVKKIVEESNKNNIRVISNVFRGKSTLPTTKKGWVRLHQDLDKRMRRFSFAGLTPNTGSRYGVWYRWTIVSGDDVGDWRSDCLSAELLIIDLHSRAPRVAVAPTKVFFTMHAIERAFLRLNTTDYSKVLYEFEYVAFLSSIMKHAMHKMCDDEKLSEVPIFLPADSGALVGDFIVCGDGSESKFMFRSFIGGQNEMTDVKEELHWHLVDWANLFNETIVASGAHFALYPYTSPELQLAMKEDIGLLDMQMLIGAYFKLCKDNILGTGDSETRREREEKLKAMWNSRMSPD